MTSTETPEAIVPPRRNRNWLRPVAIVVGAISLTAFGAGILGYKDSRDAKRERQATKDCRKFVISRGGKTNPSEEVSATLGDMSFQQLINCGEGPLLSDMTLALGTRYELSSEEEAQMPITLPSINALNYAIFDQRDRERNATGNWAVGGALFGLILGGGAAVITEIVRDGDSELPHLEQDLEDLGD